MWRIWIQRNKPMKKRHTPRAWWETSRETALPKSLEPHGTSRVTPCVSTSKTCLKTAKPLTKRNMISVINNVYDVLGWNAPVTITAKLMFNEVCLLKLHWDQEVPNDIQKKWEAWQTSLRKALSITVSRCIFKSHGNHFKIHGFADASKVAVCASIYVVTYQDLTPVDHNLFVAKSRVAPKEMSIPRLELVAAHTLAKLQNNVSKALAAPPITAYHKWIVWQFCVGWQTVGNGQLSCEIEWRKLVSWRKQHGATSRQTKTKAILELGRQARLKHIGSRDLAGYPTGQTDHCNQRSWKLMKLNPRETRKK